MKGIQLTPTTDYTVAANVVTLLDTLTAGDEVVISYFYNMTFTSIFDTFYTQAVADGLFEVKGTSYTKAASDAKYASIAAAYTKSEADAKYALIAASYTKAEADAKFTGAVITNKSANYTAVANDHILMTTGAGDKTVTLPAAASNANKKILVTKVDAAAGNVIIDGNGAETINGQLTAAISYQYDTITLKCTGTEWIII